MRAASVIVVLGCALLGCESDRSSATSPVAMAGSGGAAGSSGGAGGAPGGMSGGTVAMPLAGMGTGGMPVSTAGTGGAPELDAGVTPIADAATDAMQPEPVRCPTPALSAGDHEGSVMHDGRMRSYVMHVPAMYSGATPVPLIFDFHGYGSSGRGQMGASGFRELSDQHGFVALYPDGIGGSWHVNGCCGQAAQEELDEIGAVRAILDQVQAQVCVDPTRIYASGISQGGGMAHHVGCLAADVFAAIAPVSSDLRTEPCAPSRPVSELSFRGMADNLSPYGGGPVGPVGMQYQAIGAVETLERWRMIDECAGSAQPTLELCETYTECAAGVEVTLCSIPGGGHVLYTNPSAFDIAGTAWAMFERQSL